MTDQPNTPPAAPPATPPDSPVSPGAVQTKQIGKYEVTVDRSKCIGAASCVAIAPNVFQLDEANIAKVVSQNGDPDDTKLLAAQSCPTMAIFVKDTETGQQVWPPQAG